MGDITTLWQAEAGAGDWAALLPSSIIWTDESGNAIIDQGGDAVSSIFTAGGVLATGDDLFTAVLISLFSDAAAGADDAVPDRTGDPRGWWGGAIGSKIWLRMRSKQTAITLALVKHDIETALAWLVADGVAATVTVGTEWTRAGMLGARVSIMRVDGTTRALAFAGLWEQI